MKEKFIDHNFKSQSLATIEFVNEVLAEYEAQGFRLSLRQVYYQLVARAYIENSQRSYKRLGNLVSNARQSGLIDWDMIEDRGRALAIPAHWRDPAQIVRAAARSFRIDKWADQPYHVEVMVEKDALSGVLGPVCSELDIGLTANKGYSSSSTMHEAGQRLRYRWIEGKKSVILYLGDHDPSGIDMTRDIEDRLDMYSGPNEDEDGGPLMDDELRIDRLALNWNQVEEWQPPKNPAKESDSRFQSYAQEFGESSWELDAINPTTLADLVRDAVEGIRDADLWVEAIESENEMKKELQDFVDGYNA